MPPNFNVSKWWKDFTTQHQVLSNISILATGTAATQALVLIVSIFTARIFSPAVFGEFALFSAIVGVFVVIATLRYDLAVVLPDTDNDARQLIRLSTRTNFIVSIAATALAFALRPIVLQIWGSQILATWIPLIGVAIFCSAQVSIWQYWYNRKRQYKVIALNRFESGAGTSFGQLGLGLAGLTSLLGLIAGNLMGLLWALFILGRQSRETRIHPTRDTASIWEMANRYKKMPLLNLPNALIDAVRTNGIQMLIGAIALESLGQFNLAWRILQAPIALLNGAIAQVFLERMARVKRGELTRLVRAVMKRATLFGIPPFVLLWILSPWLVPLIFGPNWVQAGLIARAIVPWLAMNLIASPLSGVFVVTGRQLWILLHTIVFTAVPLLWLAFSPLDFMMTLHFLSLMMAFMLLVLVFIADLAAQAYDKAEAAETGKPTERTSDDEIGHAETNKPEQEGRNQ